MRLWVSLLASVAIPGSVTNIGDDAFANCSNLTSVTIGNGVTSLGQDAFVDCSSLTRVTIPGSVTNIEPEAFEDSLEADGSLLHGQCSIAGLPGIHWRINGQRLLFARGDEFGDQILAGFRRFFGMLWMDKVTRPMTTRSPLLLIPALVAW